MGFLVEFLVGIILGMENLENESGHRKSREKSIGHRKLKMVMENLGFLCDFTQ